MPPPRRAGRGGSAAVAAPAAAAGHRRTADGGRIIVAWGVELTVDAPKARRRTPLPRRSATAAAYRA